MPLQNRVTPTGEIVATTTRGTFMGNRGILHDETKRIVRQSRSSMWLICRLQFNGRRREVMGPGTYTELFFLDEAVALAAGHRPCGECRRRQYRAFIDAANVGGDNRISGAQDLDRLLNESRRRPRLTAPIAELPDGTFIMNGDNDFRLVRNNALHRWSHDSYTDAVAIADAGFVSAEVITPPLSVAALRSGYPVQVHQSIDDNPVVSTDFTPTPSITEVIELPQHTASTLSPELLDEIKRHLRGNPVRHGEVFRAMEQGHSVEQMGTSRANAQKFKNSVDAMLTGALPATKSAAMTNSYGYRYLLRCDLSPELISHTKAFLRRLTDINPAVRANEALHTRALPDSYPGAGTAGSPANRPPSIPPVEKDDSDESPAAPSLPSASMRGHLFIINGDLNKIACDAVLLPTDNEFTIESKWDGLVEDYNDEIPDMWDGRNVIPLSARHKKPRVWLGNVGQYGEHSEFSVFASVVEEFVDNAAAEAADTPHRERIYDWPLPRLAVNVVGSGKGGGRGKKGDLTVGLVGTLTTLAQEHEVDIILVTRGDKAYAAAQWARRKLLGEAKESDAWPLRDDLISKAEALADDAQERQLVLFIGAGVSAGAGVDTWKGLLENLAVEAEFTSDQRELLKAKDLRDQATLIESALPETGDSFKKRVAERICERQHYSLAHGLLASLPSKEAVTTNFDELFEDAVGREAIAVLPKDARKTDGRLLLKLHGSIDQPEDMILTRADYLRMPRQYGALMGLVQGLLMMRKMVFVGYSLSDEDFHDLVDEVRAARGDNVEAGRGTVLTLSDDDLERQLWKQDLDTVPLVVGDECKDDLSGAARQLELFLDLVGYLAVPPAAFFLDESYADLTKSESELIKPLKELVSLTATSGKHTVGDQVREFLTRLGAD
ncbi:SIR2 family NAD-dependent protein deacylase [Mycolicibacterium sp. XJ870]